MALAVFKEKKCLIVLYYLKLGYQNPPESHSLACVISVSKNSCSEKSSFCSTLRFFSLDEDWKSYENVALKDTDEWNKSVLYNPLLFNRVP